MRLRRSVNINIEGILNYESTGILLVADCLQGLGSASLKVRSQQYGVGNQFYDTKKQALELYKSLYATQRK
jgi:hypothetical protein